MKLPSGDWWESAFFWVAGAALSSVIVCLCFAWCVKLLRWAMQP